MGGPAKLEGPDLKKGLPQEDVIEGKPLLGHCDGEGVILVRKGREFLAIGASCTHYGGPLAEGLVVGDTIRCPWHHACFSLRTGEVTRAPALSNAQCWKVEERHGRVYVAGKTTVRVTKRSARGGPKRIVIIGGGAAALSAADTLRREDFMGTITLLSADESPPVDRPNLSKDYLAGTAPEEWIPLKPPEWFASQVIDLVLGARVASIEVSQKRVLLENGKDYAWDALLLATGAEPMKLTIPGAELPHVFVLRTLADSRAIIAKCAGAKRAVVMGASFIGLEAAASLRARGIEVHVVAPETRPLERVLGPEIGDFVKKMHEEHGVVFHLGNKAKAIDAANVVLESGETIAADLVVAGVGVRPALDLAQKAGLKLDRGLVVDAYLQSSVPGIYAAGDIARWPDPHSGQNIRVEHWVVAQRQGQIAARNMLGHMEPCKLVPFFWSQHYDVGISYVGHAEKWDRIEIDGSLEAKDCEARYILGDKTLAVATIGRDSASLKAELSLEAS
jgi:NADPH-dependent 2,4-dienoyl-CoA reductase/sulfur reductase-like enzyme/nitrite reductase/ring-hydroxylating ferredoxin subunit